MRKVALITVAALTLVACDDSQTFDGAASEDSCPEVPDVNPEGEQEPDSTPTEPDSIPGKKLVVPENSVHDVTVSIEEDAADIADVLVEFKVGSDRRGGIHIIRGPQMSVELVEDGQTLVAIQTDVAALRASVQAGVSCGSVVDEYTQVVFADPEFLAAAAQQGATQTHAVAMQIAVEQSPELGQLLAGKGDDAICEDECDMAGAIGGSAAGTGGAAWCCVGTAGLGCIPCAAGAGAGGVILGGLISAGCKGLFC
jgi:hypothetical protein